MQFINDSVIVTFLLDHLLDISLIVLIAIFAISLQILNLK